MKMIIKLREKYQKESLSISLYLTMFFMILYNPLKNIGIISFNRVLGTATSQGIDIARLVQHFYFGYIILLPIFFIVCSIFVSYIIKKLSDFGKDDIIKWMNNYVIFAGAALIVDLIERFNVGIVGMKQMNWLMMGILLITLIAVLGLCPMNIVSVDVIKWNLCISICMGYPIAVILSKWLNNKYIFVISILFIYAILYGITYKAVINRKKMEQIQYQLRFIFLALPASSLFLELCNILNQHNIFLNRKRVYVCVIYFIIAGLSIIISKFDKKNETFEWEKYAYPILIIGLTMVMLQPNMHIQMYTDFFEASNCGDLVGQFLNFGKIPILESYGGHMISGVLSGIFYAILNNDIVGAIFSPYSSYVQVFIYLLFYFLVQKFFDRETAFWSTLILPISASAIGYSYWGIGVGVILVMCKFLKEQSLKNGILYWQCLVLLCLYRLDLGFSVLFGTVCVILLYILLSKQKRLLYNFFMGLLITGATWGTLALLLCFIKKINILNRIQEFLKINASNQNWGYGNVGDTSVLLFSIAYVFTPIVIIMTLFYIGVKCKKSLEIDEKLYIILALGMIYIFNLQRGLVRHSVAEMNITCILFTGTLFLILFISEQCKKIKMIVFVTGFMGTSIIGGLLINNGNFNIVGVLETSMSRFSSMEVLNEEYNERQTRVVISENMKAVYEPVQSILEQLLSSEETWADFTNQTLLYGILRKENPTYISQSPGHLNGEFTQEQFISQIQENENVKLILMPNSGGVYNFDSSLDGVQNTFRYYKVAEFIYNNYRPLCVAGGFALWCKTDEYEAYLQKIAAVNNESNVDNQIQLCDYGYDSLEIGHSYNIGQIPYLWANKDTKKAIDNKVVNDKIQDYGNGILGVNCYDFDKSKGNYLYLELTANAPTTANVIMGNTQDLQQVDSKAVYSFNVLEGTNKYLIRVSSDYYWYTDSINALQIASEGNLNVESIKLLEGD